jgi:GTP cyclohydrolase IA
MNQTRVETLFRELIREVEPETSWGREDLADTPRRAAHAWAEWCSGYAIDPYDLIKTFGESAEDYDELVVVSNIPFTSHCAHHLAAIEGVAHVGYLPLERVIGLSKIPRIVDAYARRLQTQEALTTQIADCLLRGLRARAVGVVIRARHACLSTRGARVQGAEMVTSALRGLFKTNDSLRAEFLRFIPNA